MNLNDIVTKADLLSAKEEILKSIAEMLNSEKQSSSNANWVKTEKACDILDCCRNSLKKMRINGVIKAKQLKGGHWYYSVKSINEYFESKNNAA